MSESGNRAEGDIREIERLLNPVKEPEPEKSTQNERRSVLTRRAALFAGIAAVAAVAVVFCGLFLVLRFRETDALQAQLSAQTAYMAEMVEAGQPLEEAAELIATAGGAVWRVGEDWQAECLTGDMAYPGVDEGVDNGALEPAAGAFRRDGRRWVYADAIIGGDAAHFSGRVAAALPIKGLAGTGLILLALVAALAGLIAAAAALAGPMRMQKTIQEKVDSIARLRDVAVAMAEGDLEARADDAAPDEVGQLGKAVNNLSDQLSRNLYMLIVERNRLRNMLNGLSEAIVAIDAQGEITHTNPALDKFFTRQKLALHLPDPRMKLIPDQSIWEDFDRVIRTGEAATRTLNSRDMILSITITPIVDEIGAIAGAVGLFSDITQSERLEKTRRDYVSNVSHELRTPLTAMRALIEPLKEGMVTEEADRQRYYDIILREIMRLSRLINDQLELSRLQSGTLSIEKSVMRLDDLVYDVCDRYNTIAKEHGLELRIDTDFAQCPTVYANADRVEQMLIILLDNAIKYTEEGSVAVSADWDDNRVVIHVKDTGIGIDESDLPYVFDRFYKVDKAHSGKGSGLGLSIAKELLKRMDEEIWVESVKGEGTEFSFTVGRNAKAEDQGSGNRK